MGSSSSRSSAGCRTTRASRAIRFPAEASSGLMSISRMARCSTTNWLNCTTSSSRALRSTGLRPRTPCRARKMLVRSIMRRASVELSGGRPNARSRNTSTSWPPHPNRITGPSWESMLLPRISSYASSRIIGCTVTPSKCPSPALSRTECSMDRYASRTISSPLRFRWTPPTSVLCVMVLECSFKTTG